MVEQLWAPWRFDYVSTVDSAPKVQGCLFCELPKLGDNDQTLIVARRPLAYCLLNRFPYTSGHLMVTPFRHVGTMEELKDEELLEINQLVRNATIWLQTTHKPDGFNIGVNQGKAAGAGIPGHIHWHIVPRWAGDTNYMTPVGGVRVIPQSLESAWKLIREAAGEAS